MPEVTIRMRPNGPLVIEGPFKLIDSRGAEFDIPANKPAVALCRCGQSSKRPFCDGSHKTCGFVSDEAPTPPAVGPLDGGWKKMVRTHASPPTASGITLIPCSADHGSCTNRQPESSHILSLPAFPVP